MGQFAQTIMKPELTQYEHLVDWKDIIYPDLNKKLRKSGQN